eukprot:gene9375-gene996
MYNCWRHGNLLHFGPHRLHVSIATTTKICTRVALKSGPRQNLRSAPHALLLSDGFVSERRRTIRSPLGHRQFSEPVHSTGELLHTP